MFMFFIFFFQAEDGIRDRNVTGVQTCALPIYEGDALPPRPIFRREVGRNVVVGTEIGLHRRQQILLGRLRLLKGLAGERSEERRVGKECRCRWWPYRSKKTR